MLDDSGNKVAESRHYPYGAERWSSGAMPTDYRWTGQRSESSLGLYHMGARFYDPALGRWLSADTMVPEPGEPQSLNRFAYVYNNPLRFVDPTGMFTEEELVELGAYTWEEIKALRGTDWYYLLMDPDAQIGASIYFGNGIADYTGPMGMGTFYMSGGDLMIGGDVSLWNRDRGGYDSRKVWTSTQQWGELFNAASHAPDSYGLISAPPIPDYRAYNASFGGIVGVTGTIIRDKYGSWYFAAGGAVGESATLFSVNISQGWLLVSEEPGEEAMEQFCTGWALNVNAGSIIGMAYTDSLGRGQPGAFEVGLYSPQIGFSFQHGWKLPIPK